MIHYHGLPITPVIAAARALEGGHAFVSFRHPEQLEVAVQLCQSFAVDNGAFSAWRAGEPVTDWRPYYAWVEGLRHFPGFDFAVIPDVIDGSEADNDRLIEEWPWTFGRDVLGAPVWHLHESITRLRRLADEWPRVCLGSSGDYAQIGTQAWWRRMAEAMDAICVDGRPVAKIHGLRMLAPEVVSAFPFASADSTNIARNIGIDCRWTGSYAPLTKDARAALLRHRIELNNSPARWVGVQQSEFTLEGGVAL